MEFQVALLARITKSFEPRTIARGIQLGGNDDHGFFDERRAEGFQLAIDHFEGMYRIVGIRVARVDQMDEKARAFDVAEEADAQARTFVCAFDEAGKIGDDKSTAQLGAVPTGAPVGVDDP